MVPAQVKEANSLAGAAATGGAGASLVTPGSNVARSAQRSGVVTVEDLALRPCGAPVTGGAIRREDHSAGRHIDGLGLIQRTHSGKDPQISRRSME